MQKKYFFKETCGTVKVSIVLRPIWNMTPQEKILKTSLDLFFKYGIKHITMDDIARELGMSKKTIYQFFREKDDLVNQLCVVELQDHQCQFDEVNTLAKDPVHEAILISDKIRQMVQHINPMFFLDLQKFYPAAFQKYQTFKENYAYATILDNVRRGMEQGLYREDLDPEFVGRLRLAHIDMLMFGNYFSYDKISLAKTHDLLLDVFIFGICNLKGHKLFNHYKKIKEEA